MSRLGKRSINIPQGVEVKLEDGFVGFKGPKGSLSVKKLSGIEVTITGNEIVLQTSSDSQQVMMNWGTLWSLINNAILGVSQGYSKSLEIEGIGFKASMEGGKLVLKVGFSHPITFSPPEDINITVEKNEITVSGINKEKVGQTASDIRKIKKPEPYLGKGIRYKGEVIRRKAGKKAGATA